MGEGIVVVCIAQKLILPGDLAEDTGELIGTGGTAPGAVDAAQAFDGKVGCGSLKKRPEGLEVAVAAGQILKVMDTPVNQVEIYQLGAYQPTGSGRNMTDTILDGIN